MPLFARITVLSFITLITLVNPLGLIPSYLALTDGPMRSVRRKVALFAAISTVIVLAVFLLAGDYLFRFFGITLESFQVMGGILFLTRALRYLLEEDHRYDPVVPTWDEEVGPVPPARTAAVDPLSIAIVPIAIPMLSGPGAISSVMVLVNLYRGMEGRLAILTAIVLVGVVSWLAMLAAVPVSHLIGQRGQAVFAKVMALLLGAIGVQFILNGLTPFLKTLH